MKKPTNYQVIPTFLHLKEIYPQHRALFFDMDGTLLNTEAHHAEAFLKMSAKYQISAPYPAHEIHQMLIGKADYLVYDIVRSWPGFPQDLTSEDFVEIKNQLLLSILETVDPSSYFHPQLLELIVSAKNEGQFLALVTSSEKVITEKLLSLVGLKEHFHLVLTRDDCPQHKPHPWPYHEAQRTAGIDPHEAIIFEDSDIGVSAALASGSHVIKVSWY
jgi:HAD superfamily hydrolase (TIGR01509 family)